jgi:uncharacterized protein
MHDRGEPAARLRRWLDRFDSVRVAVSGGVDSMTLALLAGRVLHQRADMFHARSPAVPPHCRNRKSKANRAREN